MNREPLVKFARERGLAVLATRGPDGTPQAALVGTAASDQAEIIFDTSIRSRKYRNIRAHDRVALVIGWDDEVTVQCEGVADMPDGPDRDRCLMIYTKQYPESLTRVADPEIALSASARTGLATATTAPPASRCTRSHSSDLRASFSTNVQHPWWRRRGLRRFSSGTISQLWAVRVASGVEALETVPPRESRCG